MTYELTVQLWATSYALAAGHRLRLSVSCSDFPRIWPSAIDPRIRLQRGAQTPSRIVLPCVPPASDTGADVSVRRLDSPVTEASWDVGGSAEWKITEDLTRQSASVVLGGQQALRKPDGSSFAVKHSAVATVVRTSPDRARVRATAHLEMDLRGGERVEVRTRALFHRDHMAYSGEVTIDGFRVFERSWVHP